MNVARVPLSVVATTWAHAPTTIGASSGPVPVLPNAHWLYQYGDGRRLAQTQAVRLPDAITAEQLTTLLHSVIAAHPALRSRLDRNRAAPNV